jgi:hypothetical protein
MGVEPPVAFTVEPEEEPAAEFVPEPAPLLVESLSAAGTATVVVFSATVIVEPFSRDLLRRHFRSLPPTDHVGTAALGYPAERSSATSLVKRQTDVIRYFSVILRRLETPVE